MENELVQRKTYLKNEIVETIYFGGGTPSVLSVDEVKNILTTIQKNYNISETVEITFEANPDDISETYVAGLVSTGINRFSLGVQSFNDQDLKLMNRRHNAMLAKRAIDILQNNVENYSVDLIYAIPGSSIDILKQNLFLINTFNIPHVSIYHLTYEEGTIFYHKLKKQRLTEVGEEESVQQYNLIRKELTTNGLLHYEISNYGKERFMSRHNTSYWFGKKYLGVGPSAHSYDGNTRQWNMPALQKYMQAMESSSVCFEKETLTSVQKYNEFVMVRLRTMWGIQHAEIEKMFGKNKLNRFLDDSKPFVGKNILIQSTNETRMNPEKFILSDYVIAELFEN